jgi:signal peptidase
MSGTEPPPVGDDTPPNNTPPETNSPGVAEYGKDVFGSAGAVILVGVLLFAVSGVWPPLVAIESPSMEPHIGEGDLVFVMEEHRFSGPSAENGIVTAHQAEKYIRFQQPGDVIVYAPDGNEGRTPIIHRAMFRVEEGENWYDRADPDDIGSADSCEELVHCPAPYTGFITKGDNGQTNSNYDQIGLSRISDPVKPEWIIGTAELRVPHLGKIRLSWNRAAVS